MSDNNKFITLILIDADTNQTKKWLIPQKIYQRFGMILKTIVILLIVLLVLLILLLISYFSNREQNFQNKKLKQELQNIKIGQQIHLEKQIKILEKSKITMNELENYLKLRGVAIEPFFTQIKDDAKGGPAGNLKDDETLQNKYYERPKALLSAIQKMPLGYAHIGRITSTFGNRNNPFTGQGHEGHGGVDFAGVIGDPIKATANGRVLFAGEQRGFGLLVQLKHGYGYETYYGHLSAIDVSAGQKVKAGDTIGKLGSTGRSTGPHLHYEVRLKGERKNPMDFLMLKNK